MTTAASILAPTFHAVRNDKQFSEIADASAPLYAFAPDVVRLHTRLLVPLSENLEGVKLPAERFWFELRGGSGAGQTNSVLAYSVSPGRLIALQSDGDAFTLERDGLSMPAIDRARETNADDWRSMFVLFVGPFLALCALLDAPGIEQTKTGSIIEVKRDPARAHELAAWLDARRADSE